LTLVNSKFIIFSIQTNEKEGYSLIIKSLYLFRDLNDTEITRSLHCSRAEVVEFEKNSYIFQQDEEPEHLYLILSGTVLIGQTNINGRQAYAEYLREGSCFGEIDLFLQKDCYDYSSLAKTDVKLLAVTRHFFAGACPNHCAHHQRIMFNMLHIFAEAAERNTTKIQLLTSGTLRQRIAYYLQFLSQGHKTVDLPLNREELAAYLNATRPSLSRELAHMQEEGILYLNGRKKVHILDFDLLQNEIGGAK